MCQANGILFFCFYVISFFFCSLVIIVSRPFRPRPWTEALIVRDRHRDRARSFRQRRRGNASTSSDTRFAQSIHVARSRDTYINIRRGRRGFRAIIFSFVFFLGPETIVFRARVRTRHRMCLSVRPSRSLLSCFRKTRKIGRVVRRA